MTSPLLADSPEPNGHVRMIELRGGPGAIPGVRMSGLHAGIKKRKSDLALIVFDEPQFCASVITTNEIKAAPVLVSEEHLVTHGDRMRAVVANAGCANACTGARGMRDARATARQTAALLHIEPGQVIVGSTGVIGVHLPMDRIARGLERAVKDLEHGSEAAHDAAEAIMTTDKVPKLAAFAFYDGEERYVVGGIAKGSGMIAPNLATMLAYIATNAPRTPRRAQGRAARSSRRHVQHDLRRRRHVDERFDLRLRSGRPAPRPHPRGSLKRCEPSATIWRSRWSATARAQPRR